jgi:hypothetical protein
MTDVTLVPLIIAAVAYIAVGYGWYHPRIFGDAWMRMSNISPEAIEAGKKRMPLTLIVALIAGIVVGYVLDWFGIAWGVYDWAGAVELAIWIWVGFVAPVLLGSVLWERRPVKLFCINAGYWLVTLVVMSLIIASLS